MARSLALPSVRALASSGCGRGYAASSGRSAFARQVWRYCETSVSHLAQADAATVAGRCFACRYVRTPRQHLMVRLAVQRGLQ